MKKGDKQLETFCPLPWMHISARPGGGGRVCCDGYESLKNNEGQNVFWKESKGLKSYFNLEDYKKIRRQMLRGERPSHCYYCFNQEDHGVRSIRLQYIDVYQSEIEDMINSTDEDGFIENPKITYVDMALGNNCNLKCRMCSPWSSYQIGKDWKQMGRPFDDSIAKRIFQDKWYASPQTFQMLKEALPHVRDIFSTGGEPMLIKEHLQILKMIVEEGHADHISLRYNSNQTVIPEKIIELWRHFKAVNFNCSVDGFGELNSYIRYPSRWEKQTKNIHFLDQLSYESNNIEVFIHSTLQAYNISRIPELLGWLKREEFKSLHRVPFFILVRIPEWCSPSVFPQEVRNRATNKILDRLDEYEEFFLNYNPEHQHWSKERVRILREFCRMIQTDSSQEKHLPQFIEETKKHDRLRRQSVLKVLPELSRFFP